MGQLLESAGASVPAILRVHYVRKDHNYKGWGLHVWGDTPSCTQWQHPLKPTRSTARGLEWDLPLRPGAQRVGATVHKGEQKAASGEVQITAVVPDGAAASGTASPASAAAAAAAATPAVVQEAWLLGDEQSALAARPKMYDVPAGSVKTQAAHWVSRGLLLWRQDPEDAAGPRSFRLHLNRQGRMWVSGFGVQGAEESWDLFPAAPCCSAAAVSAAVERFPHLYGCTALLLPPAAAAARIVDLLTGQLMVSVRDAAGEALDSTGVQVQGVLDEVMSYDGPLGDHPDAELGGHAITVWAPTATEVQVLHYQTARGGEPDVYWMGRGGRGTWTLPRPADWLWSYYTFRVTAWNPWTARFETLEVADPYSRGLSADGARSQIVDLAHPDTYPPGWEGHAIPPIDQWTDISVYELHVRDFSITDETVPEPLRGKYLAFCPDRVRQRDAAVTGGEGTGGGGGLSAGLAHLAALRSAGLNHLQLLPTYDFATASERTEEQAAVQEDLPRDPTDSTAQQSAVLAVADRDGFNRGCHPVHYCVPGGSYATDPDGIARIREFREMVQALHGQGWRVVRDVVYDHTFAPGPFSRYSVLDKIVPGYYHRRHEDGSIADSTCCNNIATDRAMYERLVVDDITHWARNYKVDGFRFDIMGHLSMSTMTKIRASLDSLTPEKDGVVGTSIYIYGEAWDFGEVAGNHRGRSAAQMNLAETSGSRVHPANAAATAAGSGAASAADADTGIVRSCGATGRGGGGGAAFCLDGNRGDGAAGSNSIAFEAGGVGGARDEGGNGGLREGEAPDGM